MRLMAYAEKPLPGSILARGVRRNYKANTLFFNYDEQAWKAYYLEKGLVKFSLFSQEGNQRTALYLTAGSIFGEYGLLTNSYGATAIAVVDCVVVSFDREQFERLINEDLDFARLCINSLVEKLWWVIKQYNATCFLDRFGKIANGLLWLARRWGEPASLACANNNCPQGLMLKITHQELAEFTGTNRSTVTTVLDFFAAKKIIQKKTREILIIDPEKLKSWTG